MPDNLNDRQTLTVQVTVHDGSGPMYLREHLADANMGPYSITFTRIVGVGALHAVVIGPDDRRATVVVTSEQDFMESVANLGIARLEASR